MSTKEVVQLRKLLFGKDVPTQLKLMTGMGYEWLDAYNVLQILGYVAREY